MMSETKGLMRDMKDVMSAVSTNKENEGMPPDPFQSNDIGVVMGSGVTMLSDERGEEREIESPEPLSGSNTGNIDWGDIGEVDVEAFEVEDAHGQLENVNPAVMTTITKIASTEKNKDMAVVNGVQTNGGSDSDDVDWGDMNEVDVDAFDIESATVKQAKTVKQKVVRTTINKNPVHNPVMAIPAIPKRKDGFLVLAPTKIRVSKPQLTAETWRERVTGRQVVTVSSLSRQAMVDGLTDKDWVLVGVVVHKSATKVTKNGKNYSIWVLNDLQCIDKVVKLMLFGDVYTSLWTETEGTVVAVLRPREMKSDGVFREQKERTYTVDEAAQVMVIGLSPDYGTCEGVTKEGKRCSNIVNKGDCSLCNYHVSQGYKAATSRPGFTDIMTERLNARKRPQPEQVWKPAAKKAKDNGIRVNSSVGPSLSMEKMQRAGITATVSSWGVLDTKAVQSATANTVTTTGDLSLSEQKFAETLKKRTAGSMNVIMSVAEASLGVTATKKKLSLTGGPRPTASGILEQMRESRGRPRMSAINQGELVRASREAYQADLNKKKAIAMAMEAGGLEALRERNRHEHLQAAGRTNKKVALLPVANKPVLSERLMQLMQQKSANQELATVGREIEQDKKLDRLEKVERMEMKMASITEKSCAYFFCRQCQTKTACKPTLCVLEGHTVDREQGRRRFFRCLKCKHRVVTMERYPEKACDKCGANVFEKAGMLAAKEVVVQEKALVDGGEKRFINN